MASPSQASSHRLHPPIEQVRFAQGVLNAVEGERLLVTGILGPRTRTALERFRGRHGLRTASALDETTLLALVQRALGELGYTPLRITGAWDDATRQALTEFKQLGGLDAEPTLDAATLAALADALKPRAAVLAAADGIEGFLKDNPEFRQVPLSPQEAILVNPSWPGRRRSLAQTYNRLGGLMNVVASRLSIELPAVLAVWNVESHGHIHTPGRAMIRFENHIFFRVWGRSREAIYDQHFRHGGRGGLPGKPWEHHQYRERLDQPFRPVHSGNLADEYAALNLATRLAGESLALQCISIGGPQIMVFNHRMLGYRAPREMYDAFQADERWHVLGFFDFCRTKEAPRPGQLVQYLRQRNWQQFAYYYNGPGAVAVYSRRLSEAYSEARQLPPPVN